MKIIVLTGFINYRKLRKINFFVHIFTPFITKQPP